MNDKLLKDILSMDAYNRGYNSGIDLNVYDTNGNLLVASDAVGNNAIGNYSVFDSNGDQAAQDAGFYGIAYQHVETDPQSPDYQDTIISYRGTDGVALERH